MKERIRLPEAQLDRFLIKIEAHYPSEARELELLQRVANGFDARALEASGVTPVTNAAEVLEAQRTIRTAHLSDGVRDYVYRIVAETRKQRRLRSARRRARASRCWSRRKPRRPSAGATSSRRTTSKTSRRSSFRIG